MFDHPFADIRRIKERFDTCRPQPVRIANARTLQQQRAFHRTCRNNDLACAGINDCLTVNGAFDTTRFAVGKVDAFGKCTGYDFHIGSLAGWIKEGTRRALPPSMVDIVGIQADPRSSAAVEVVDPLQSQTFACCNHRVA